VANALFALYVKRSHSVMHFLGVISKFQQVFKAMRYVSFIIKLDWIGLVHTRTCIYQLRFHPSIFICPKIYYYCLLFFLHNIFLFHIHIQLLGSLGYKRVCHCLTSSVFYAYIIWFVTL